MENAIHKECQFCAEFISVNANLCKHCNNQQHDRKRINRNLFEENCEQSLINHLIFIPPLLTIFFLKGVFLNALVVLFFLFLLMISFWILQFFVTRERDLSQRSRKPQSPLKEERRKRIIARIQKRKQKKEKENPIPILLQKLENKKKNNKKSFKVNLAVGCILSLLFLLSSQHVPTLKAFKEFSKKAYVEEIKIDDVKNLEAFTIIKGKSKNFDYIFIGIFNNYYTLATDLLAPKEKESFKKEQTKLSLIKNIENELKQ